MDDGFINTSGDRTPFAIGNEPPLSAGAAREAVVASPELSDPSGHLDFEAFPPAQDIKIERQVLLADANIGIACELALGLLNSRIAGGDAELLAVKCVVQRCLSLISAMPPLSHFAGVPLRPDDRLYECFDHFLSLLRQQESQMQELQSMINELI